MNVLLLQTDTLWQDPQGNRERLSRLLDNAPAADLFVLPEMFTTGFVTSPAGVAEKDAVQTLEWMRSQAARLGAAIAGSVATEESGRYYNRFFFVKPDGSVTSYDKRHLFSYAGEHHEYTGGGKRVVVEYMGVRILLQICYDLRFPVFARNRGDYDMILYVADWPEVRIGVWDTLLRARAIENLCYVAGVNRVGDEPVGHYVGHSALIDFKGNAVTEAPGDRESMTLGVVDMEALGEFRTKFPALADADDFTINER